MIQSHKLRMAALFTLLIVGACSIQTENCSDVNQDKIYQDYSVSYDPDANETSVRAQFRFGGVTGTTLAMDGKCAIVHDAIGPLEKEALSSLIGTSYGGSKAGYVAANVFTFTNNSGTEFSNSITNQNTLALSSPPTAVSRAAGVTISFSPAVAAHETVGITIAYASAPEGATTTSVQRSTSASGATSVNFSSSDLAELTSNRDVYLSAKRLYSKDLDAPSASEGGSIYYHYYSTKSTASLAD